MDTKLADLLAKFVKTARAGGVSDQDIAARMRQAADQVDHATATVRLGEGDSVLVARKGGKIEYILPRREVGDLLSDDEIVVMFLATQFRDRRLVELVREYVEEGRKKIAGLVRH